MPLETMSEDDKLGIAAYIATCFCATGTVVTIQEAVARWEDQGTPSWNNVPVERQERYKQFWTKFYQTRTEMGE